MEQEDVAAGRQALDVTLEVPLRLFPLGRCGPRVDLGDPGVEVLRHPLDRAALSRLVPALEDQNDPGALGTHPFLLISKLVLLPEHLPLFDARLQWSAWRVVFASS